MADTSYGPKVYRKQGGNTLVVASGGDIQAESGGTIQLEQGTRIYDDQPQESSLPSLVFMYDIDVANSTTGAKTVDLTITDRVQIIDAFAKKYGGGASGTTVSTVQVQSSTGGAITNAINVKVVDNTIVRAGTINDALAVRAAGGVIRVVRAGSAGSSTGATGLLVGSIVHVLAVKRST